MCFMKVLPYAYPFYPMYNVSTSVVIGTYWGIICPSGLRPSGHYSPICPDHNRCIISISSSSGVFADPIRCRPSSCSPGGSTVGVCMCCARSAVCRGSWLLLELSRSFSRCSSAMSLFHVAVQASKLSSEETCLFILSAVS